MRILLTNDDGVEAPMLAALAAQLDTLGDVDVIAPATDMTGVSRSLSLAGPIAVDEIRLPDGRPAFAVSGTPADCVRFGALGLAGGRPDVVISGPNRGVNLGDDVAYSGTVAAALEAALLGLPAAALSQHGSEDDSYDATELGRFALTLVPMLASGALPPGVVINVNAPAGTVAGVRVARLGRRRYRPQLRPAGEAEGGRRHYRLYGAGPLRLEGEPGTDIAAVAEGFIAITPLRFDLYAEDAMAALAAVAREPA
ncbi:MAG TPA: 5'/3'-nucleotidase SurE [Gaiellales bacterium]|jgi:5'-nucleotidase|nr:5'/3'-nucleotidase SurE [Gaiellales bacterium]